MFATPGCIRLRGFSLLACGQLPVVRDVKCGEALVLACDLRAQLVPQLVGNLEEDFDDRRVELGAGAAQHLLARGIEASCGAVGTVACDGVKRVGDSENTRADRDFDPSQTARITAAVKVFLVAKTIAAASLRNGILRRLLLPRVQCSRMLRCSSAETAPGFCRM